MFFYLILKVVHLIWTFNEPSMTGEATPLGEYAGKVVVCNDVIGWNIRTVCTYQPRRVRPHSTPRALADPSSRRAPIRHQDTGN